MEGTTSHSEAARRSRLTALAVALAILLVGPQASAAERAPVPIPLSAACQTTANPAGGATVLPATAEAVSKTKKLKVLAIGSASAKRAGGHKGFVRDLEAMLEKAVSGLDVQIVNRGVSGELAADAANRMKIEIALHRPDLVIWQVGTHDALAFVSIPSLMATVESTARWLREHKVDLVIVGMRYAQGVAHDEHYQKMRKALRRLAEAEKIMIISRYDAAEALATKTGEDEAPALDTDSTCAAEYAARAISVNLFAKKPAPPPQN